MAEAVSVLVPNIGDFQDVPVVDVLVKAGDAVAIDDPLVTLESDKATMEVPSPNAGVVRSVAVRTGDKVSEGSVLLTLSATNGTSSTESSGDPQASLLELRVPDIGNFSDVPVIDVLVAPGQRIDVDTPIVTLESEKTSMDIPATSAGTVRDIRVKPGDKVSQGTPILTLEAEAASPGSAQSPAPPSPAASAVSHSEGTGATPPERARAATSNGVVHASPSIRRFARELGVDLGALGGTGPHERITRDDVQAYVKRSLAEPRPDGGTGATGFNVLPWPKIDFSQFGPTESVALSRIRKISGPNLHRNWVMIPHVTNNDAADITELERFRKELAADANAKVTMLAFVIKAVVAALQACPEVNSSLVGDSLILKRYYHIGFAADTPDGLMVPVLKDADRKGVLAIASETAALAAKARDGKLALSDMQGASFTVSSLGGIGGTSFTPIVNAPEVAILGVSRSAIRPMWDGSAFVPRLMLPLSLSYDHRVIDGALAARFNAYLAGMLKDMRRALL